MVLNMSVEVQDPLDRVNTALHMRMVGEKGIVSVFGLGTCRSSSLPAGQRIQRSGLWRPLTQFLPAIYQRACHVGEVDGDRGCAVCHYDVVEDLSVCFGLDRGADGVSC